jgi:hypothetical protein
MQFHFPQAFVSNIHTTGGTMLWNPCEGFYWKLSAKNGYIIANIWTYKFILLIKVTLLLLFHFIK